MAKYNLQMIGVLAIVGVFLISYLTINFSGITVAGILPGKWSKPPQGCICTDSDGKDLDPYKVNYITYNEEKFYDKCPSTWLLAEMICINNIPYATTYNCTDDKMICKYGKCQTPTLEIQKSYLPDSI